MSSPCPVWDLDGLTDRFQPLTRRGNVGPWQVSPAGPEKVAVIVSAQGLWEKTEPAYEILIQG